MKIAKRGDIIEWTFPQDHGTIFAGKTFSAEVAMVDEVKKEYGVYAEYGQDLIGFEDAKIVENKN